MSACWRTFHREAPADDTENLGINAPRAGKVWPPGDTDVGVAEVLGELAVLQPLLRAGAENNGGKRGRQRLSVVFKVVELEPDRVGVHDAAEGEAELAADDRGIDCPGDLRAEAGDADAAPLAVVEELDAAEVDVVARLRGGVDAAEGHEADVALRWRCL